MAIIKAHKGNRSKNLESISDAIFGFMADHEVNPENNSKTEGEFGGNGPVHLPPDVAHKIKGYCEQLRIIAEELQVIASNMTTKERFAEEHGISLIEVGKLCQLADTAADLQEKVHNERDELWQSWQSRADAREAIEGAIEQFEQFAKTCGFDGVDWPGLYPNLTKGTRHWITLPRA